MNFMARRHRRRWSDNDRHFGPFTFAYSRKYRPFALVLCSGSEAHEDPGCCLRFQAFGFTAICNLPQIIKPWRHWVDTSKYDWSGPGAGYWDEHPREYGFSLSEHHFHVRLGAQTMDSSTTQDWGCFLPWTQWRQVAHRLYNADGELAADVANMPWEQHFKIRDGLTRQHFAIIDYDGERINVETFVEERERRLGTGWFRWLGYIAPKRRSRSMDIRFDAEVGPEKGSWKGGTIGHGITMLDGETQEQAMRRYCDQEHRAKSHNFRISFAEAS